MPMEMGISFQQIYRREEHFQRFLLSTFCYRSAQKDSYLSYFEIEEHRLKLLCVISECIVYVRRHYCPTREFPHFTTKFNAKNRLLGK